MSCIRSYDSQVESRLRTPIRPGVDLSPHGQLSIGALCSHVSIVWMLIGRYTMRSVIFAVILVGACANVAAAGPWEDAVSAYRSRHYPTAAQLFRSLAKQGHERAQYNLGMLYRDGLGIPQDFVRAHMWYSVSAVTWSDIDGKETAMKERDVLASQMTAAQLKKAQEMARHCQDTKFKECD